MQKSGNLGQYHPRRTLDQFAYPRLKDTTARDADQTISRLTQSKDSPDAAKMIMVDQLWLSFWMEIYTNRPTEYRVSRSTIVSSFPDTSYKLSTDRVTDGFHLAEIRQAALENLQSRTSVQDYPYKAPEIAASILSTALLGTLSIPDIWELNFLELFQEAIGDVTEQHFEFFRRFEESLTQKQTTSNSNSLDPVNILRKGIRAERRRREIKLGLEVADMLDELGMLKLLFKTQKDTLEKGLAELGKANFVCLSPFIKETKQLVQTLESVYLPKIHRMIEDLKRLHENLLELLGLQQKEESISEAEYANQQALFAAKQALSAQAQADATEAQSQILVVFTIVTIVFLPLSFVTSYYGMNIVGGLDEQAKTESKNYQITDVKAIFGQSLGGVAGLLAAAWLWYCLGKEHATLRASKKLVQMRDQGYLPKGLITEQDAEHKRMHRSRTAKLEVWWCPHCWVRYLFRERERPTGPKTTSVKAEKESVNMRHEDQPSDGKDTLGTGQETEAIPRSPVASLLSIGRARKSAERASVI